MRVPPWLTIGVAILAFVWGAYRIRIALRSDAADHRARDGKRGLFAMARRTHFLFGLVYLLLGAALVAASFGWSPLTSLITPGNAPGKDAPATNTAPKPNTGAGNSVPVEPPAKK